MAACGSLQHIFEKPLPENPTLIEALTQWNRHQMNSRKPIDLSSFSEIFGELHFHEKPINPNPNLHKEDNADDEKEKDNNDDNPPSSSSSSTWSSSSDAVDRHLQLCTEGLGSESADDVEDVDSNNASNDRFVSNDFNSNNQKDKMKEASLTEKSAVDDNRSNHLLCLESNSGRRSISRTTASSGASSFPPPISCIGRDGKPCVCFRSYRHDGRFVLKEIRIPTQEFLHACREDGRLRLHFVQQDEEISKEEEEVDSVNEEISEEEEEDQEDEEVVDCEQGNAGDEGETSKY